MPALLLTAASGVSAATVGWDGSEAGSAWAEPLNWSAGAPGAADLITLGDLSADTAQTINLNGNRSFANVASGTAITFNPTGNRDYTISGGTVSGSVLTFTNAARPITTSGTKRLTFASDMAIELTPTAVNQNFTATVGTGGVLAINSDILVTSNAFTGLRFAKSGAGILRLGGTGHQTQTTFNDGEIIVTSATAMSSGVLSAGATAKTLSLATDTQIGDSTVGWTGTNAAATIRIVESGALDRTVNFNGRLATGTLTIGANEAGSTGNVTIGVNGASTHQTVIQTIAGSKVKFGNTAQVSYTGGRVTGAGDVIVAGTANVVTSGTGDWDYTGSTTVSSGSFLVNRTLVGTSGVTVQGTGVFGGTTGVTNGVLIKAGGTLAPGTPGTTEATMTVGSLALNASGGLGFALTAGTSDRVNVGGALTTAGSGVIFNSSGNPATNGTFTLIDAGSISGYVPGINGAGTFSVKNARGKKFIFGGTSTTVTATVSTAMSLAIAAEVAGSRGTIVDGGTEFVDLTSLTGPERTAGNVQIDGLVPTNSPVVLALDVNATSESQLQALYDALVGTSGLTTIQKAGTVWASPETGVGGNVGGNASQYDFLLTFGAVGLATDPSRFLSLDIDGYGLLVNRVALAEPAAVPEPALFAVSILMPGLLLRRRARVTR